jgi:hypothetical protein
MIKKYRKKPIVVEAIQFTGDNWQEIKEWMWNNGSRRYCTERVDEKGNVIAIILKTPEGYMEAIKGDYIIKGVAGEFYPCKPGIFEATYEEVKDEA